jgi:hypothetical protein
VNDLRFWVCVLALVCFAVGISTGLLLSGGRARASRGPAAPFDEYRVAFSRRFDLDRDRERLFSELLRNYALEIEAARTRLLSQNQPALDAELVEIGDRYRGLIRDQVLPPSRREEFDTQAGQWHRIH